MGAIPPPRWRMHDCTHVRALKLALALALVHRASSGDSDAAARPSADLQTARAFYEERVARDDRDADSWHGLAVVLRRSERHADAALAMSRAVEIAPTAVRHRELGLILRLAGYEKEGVGHLVESVRGGALSPTALLMIGRFQHEQGQYDVAVRTLVLALRLTDPALRGGHAVALTMCLLDAGRYREARTAFRAAARDQLLLPASALPRSPSCTGSAPCSEPTVNPMLGVTWRAASKKPLEAQRTHYQQALEVSLPAPSPTLCPHGRPACLHAVRQASTRERALAPGVLLFESVLTVHNGCGHVRHSSICAACSALSAARRVPTLHTFRSFCTGSSSRQKISVPPRPCSCTCSLAPRAAWVWGANFTAWLSRWPLPFSAIARSCLRRLAGGWPVEEAVEWRTRGVWRAAGCAGAAGS